MTVFHAYAPKKVALPGTAAIFTLVLGLLLSIMVAIAPVAAKTTPPTPPPPPSFPAEFAKPLIEWNASLDRIDTSLSEPLAADSTLDAARANLDELQHQINAFLRELRPREEATRAQFNKLGDAPATGQPPEPEALALQRAELSKTLGDLSGAVKAADSGLERTKSLAARTREIRRQQFEQRVLRHADSPLSPRLWTDVANNAPDGVRLLGAVIADWWNRITDKTQFVTLVTIAFLLWAGLAFAAKQGVRHFRAWQETNPPSAWRRGASAGWVILLRAAPVTIAASGLYQALLHQDILPPPAVKLALSAAIALVVMAAVQAVARTVLALHRPQWRLLSLSNRGAVTLYYHLLALAVVYAGDQFVTTLNHVASMPFSLSDAQSAVASIAIAGIIISILRIRAHIGDETGEPQHIGSHYVRIPLWLIAFAILGAAAAGYIPLARFIAGQLVVTSTVIIIAYLLRFWAAAFGQSLADDGSVAGRWLRDHAGLARHRRDALVLPITLMLKGIIIASAIPFILLLWGFDVRDIGLWVEKALFGFELGNMRISITLVLGALLIFIGAYLAAGIFRVWLDRHVLEPAGVEGGVRDSVRTGVGYLGFGLAVIAAISYAGFDFSSLAIVAGALSVGVGFGMQSIVNNFVSGLILLAERPIKVGDWIVVGEDQGLVHSISVRATVIETFDRSNVIIPNSQLILQTVRNWTLHNNTGRISIPVGVPYEADAEKVRDILLEAAREHPQVLSTPEPFVLFKDFGDNALQFVLLAYIANVTGHNSVQTDLRFAILKAFRANGIEFPYPQTDVHFSDLGWIKQAIVARMMQSAAEDATPAPAPRDTMPQPQPVKPGTDYRTYSPNGNGEGGNNGGD